MISTKTHQLIGIALISISLQGCLGLYEPGTYPGNCITEKQIQQLKEGMTIREVKKLFGTPILAQNRGNVLDTEQQNLLSEENDDEESDFIKLEYIGYSPSKQGKIVQKRISLAFEDEKLKKFRVLTP